MRRISKKLGVWVIILGIIIMMAMILPSDFWIILTAAALIAAGVSMVRK